MSKKNKSLKVLFKDLISFNYLFLLFIFLLFIFLAKSEVGYGEELLDNSNPERVEEMKQKDKTVGVEAITDVEKKSSVVSNLSIENATVFPIKEGGYLIKYDVKNLGSNNLEDLKCGVSLYSPSIVSLSVENYPINDEQYYVQTVFSKTSFKLNSGNSIADELIIIPESFLNGEYEILINCLDMSGMRMAFNSAGLVTLKGSGEYIDLSSDRCFMRVNGDNKERFPLLNGVDVKEEETLELVCSIINRSEKNGFSFQPSIDFYLRSFSGEKLDIEAKNLEFLEIGVKEEKELVLNIPIPKKPQSYLSKLILKDKEGKNISNELSFRFVVYGESATLHELSLDKESYSVGEDAKLSFFWSPSAHIFRGSRNFNREKEAEKKYFLRLDFLNSNKESCIDLPKDNKMEIFSNTNRNNQEVRFFEVVKDCKNYTLKAEILNEKGEVLSTKEITSKSDAVHNISEVKEVASKKAGFILNNIFYFILVLIIIISVFIILIIKIKKNSSIGVWLLFFTVIFFGLKVKLVSAIQCSGSGGVIMTTNPSFSPVTQVGQTPSVSVSYSLNTAGCGNYATLYYARMSPDITYVRNKATCGTNTYGYTIKLSAYDTQIKQNIDVVTCSETRTFHVNCASTPSGSASTPSGSASTPSGTASTPSGPETERNNLCGASMLTGFTSKDELINLLNSGRGCASNGKWDLSFGTNGLKSAVQLEGTSGYWFSWQCLLHNDPLWPDGSRSDVCYASYPEPQCQDFSNQTLTSKEDLLSYLRNNKCKVGTWDVNFGERGVQFIESIQGALYQQYDVYQWKCLGVEGSPYFKYCKGSINVNSVSSGKCATAYNNMNFDGWDALVNYAGSSLVDKSKFYLSLCGSDSTFDTQYGNSGFKDINIDGRKGWEWKCNGINGGEPAICKAYNGATSTVATIPEACKYTDDSGNAITGVDSFTSFVSKYGGSRINDGDEFCNSPWDRETVFYKVDGGVGWKCKYPDTGARESCKFLIPQAITPGCGSLTSLDASRYFDEFYERKSEACPSGYVIHDASTSLKDTVIKWYLNPKLESNDSKFYWSCRENVPNAVLSQRCSADVVQPTVTIIPGSIACGTWADREYVYAKEIPPSRTASPSDPRFCVDDTNSGYKLSFYPNSTGFSDVTIVGGGGSVGWVCASDAPYGAIPGMSFLGGIYSVNCTVPYRVSRPLATCGTSELLSKPTGEETSLLCKMLDYQMIDPSLVELFVDRRSDGTPIIIENQRNGKTFFEWYCVMNYEGRKLTKNGYLWGSNNNQDKCEAELKLSAPTVDISCTPKNVTSGDCTTCKLESMTPANATFSWKGNGQTGSNVSVGGTFEVCNITDSITVTGTATANGQIDTDVEDVFVNTNPPSSPTPPTVDISCTPKNVTSGDCTTCKLESMTPANATFSWKGNGQTGGSDVTIGGTFRVCNITNGIKVTGTATLNNQTANDTEDITVTAVPLSVDITCSPMSVPIGGSTHCYLLVKNPSDASFSWTGNGQSGGDLSVNSSFVINNIFNDFVVTGKLSRGDESVTDTVNIRATVSCSGNLNNAFFDTPAGFYAQSGTDQHGFLAGNGVLCGESSAIVKNPNIPNDNNLQWTWSCAKNQSDPGTPCMATLNSRQTVGCGIDNGKSFLNESDIANFCASMNTSAGESRGVKYNFRSITTGGVETGWGWNCYNY